MIRRQFGDVKDQLARVTGTTGMAVTDERLIEYVNTATEELINEYDFPWAFDRLRFRVTTGRITLPGDYERIALMSLDRVPMQMQSPWFEFVGTGLDLITEVSSDSQINFLKDVIGVLDKEDCASFRDVPTDDTYTIRVFGQVDERICDERPNVTLYGYDSSGQWIRSATGNSHICATANGPEPSNYEDGTRIPIMGDTAPFYVDSTQTLSEITAAKKPVTRGKVYIYAVGTTGTPVLLAVYAPRETNPVYRRYFIPGLNSGQEYSVLARCRRRYMPIVEESDYLLISNLPAMKAMVMAIYYLEAADADKYLKYKSVAVDILKKEAKAYIGLQRQKPLITFSEGMGVRGDGTYIL